MSAMRSTRLRLPGLLIGIGMLTQLAVARAHESRPAYLEITETVSGRYDVLWRTPVLSGMRLPIALKLPDEARDVTAAAVREFSDSVVERRLVEVAGGLAGKRIEIVGLQATITDVLARVQLGNAAHSTTLVHPSQPWLEIAVSPRPLEVVRTYLALGIEHILTGTDHLLFVSGLLLLVSGFERLVKTISAFTLSHSVTLSLATLGFVHLPPAPVEAVIALSIVFVACEIAKGPHTPLSLTQRQPWLVAFAFGLLHGLGFAGGLSAAGLPAGHIPLALALFSAGVEIGHFSFLAVALALIACARRMKLPWPAWMGRLPAYGIGIVAAFWFVERLAGCWR